MTRRLSFASALLPAFVLLTSAVARADDGGSARRDLGASAPGSTVTSRPVAAEVRAAPSGSPVKSLAADAGVRAPPFFPGVPVRRPAPRVRRAAAHTPPPDAGVAAAAESGAPAPGGRGTRRKALQALETVLDQEEKTLRRIDRVEEHLRKGDTAAAMKELGRARRATDKALVVAQSFEQQEVLETSDYIIRGLSTAGIALLSLLLAVVLAMLLRRLLSRAGIDGARDMSAGVRWSYRFIVLLVAAGSLSLAVWISIRLIWRVRVSSARVMEVLEHPLFAFEGRPVTFMSILFFLVTIAFLFIISRRVRLTLERKVMPRFSGDIGVQQAFSAILHYLILFVGLLVSLEVLGVGASTVAIVAGVVGIGVGFGMQHLVNNFLSGIVLFFERPVRVGDWVDVAGVEGRVVRIHWRATTLVTRDNLTIVIPNSDFVQGKVYNLTIPDNRLRARVKVGVAYGTDLEVLERALLAVVRQHPTILQDPEPRVRILEFADSAMTIELLYWLGDLQGKDQVASDVRFAIVRAFREHGIVIPFPQRDTHIVSVDLERLPGGRARDAGDGPSAES